MNVAQALHRSVLRKSNVLSALAGPRTRFELESVLAVRDQGSQDDWAKTSQREVPLNKASNLEFRRILRTIWTAPDGIEKGFALLRRMTERIAVLETLPNHMEKQNRDLDTLFQRLRQDENTRDINDTLQSIWAVWKNHPDEVVRGDFKKALENLKSHDVGEARRNLDKVIEVDPNYAEAFNQRAMIQYMSGLPTEAVQDLIVALKLEPRHIVAWSGLAKIQREQANFEQEKECLKRILDLCPNDEVVKTRLAEL